MQCNSRFDDVVGSKPGPNYEITENGYNDYYVRWATLKNEL